jgi:hypothetical protein
MPFPDPNERPGDERGIKVEFAVLLAVLVLMLVLSVRWLWGELGSLF